MNTYISVYITVTLLINYKFLIFITTVNNKRTQKVDLIITIGIQLGNSNSIDTNWRTFF